MVYLALSTEQKLHFFILTVRSKFVLNEMPVLPSQPNNGQLFLNTASKTYILIFKSLYTPTFSDRKDSY